MAGLARAEWAKLAWLPATWVAAAVSLGGVTAVAALTATTLRSGLDRKDTTGILDPDVWGCGFDTTPVGTVGAIILGVVVVSSEYTAVAVDLGGSRQVTATLVATPQRVRVLIAKVVVVAAVAAAIAFTSTGAAVVVSQALLGPYGHPPGAVFGRLGWRLAGAVLYWVLTAELALAVAVLTCSGIVSLVALIANTSVVSVSLVLSQVTSLAKYLPDMAGAQMFATHYPAPDVLPPLTGGSVMLAWTLAALAVAAAVFARRDA